MEVVIAVIEFVIKSVLNVFYVIKSVNPLEDESFRDSLRNMSLSIYIFDFNPSILRISHKATRVSVSKRLSILVEPFLRFVSDRFPRCNPRLLDKRRRRVARIEGIKKKNDVPHCTRPSPEIASATVTAARTQLQLIDGAHKDT